MGGKTNQTQRTKNSARPSSSGRSAEFLQGTSTYTFTGFLGAATGGDTSPLKTFEASSINEDIGNVDPNVQVVLKKLTKKDAVTKGKALLELTQLVEQQLDDEAVKSLLPLWPRLYKSLYGDISHRVRENCQTAHKAFVVRLSKHIATILKQICAEWIASQFDSYAPAASVARQSLSTAFPAHKLKDVLAFCHDEILDYIHRMLLVPMPMPADKTYTPEEYEARSERLICMGLYSYNFYLNHTKTDLWREKGDRHQAILADGKFWSYAKHKQPQVKAAWLETIGAILDKAPELLQDYHAKIVPAVVHNMDESDALVQSSAWTCLLRIQLMVANWVEYTSVEKALLVKLRKVLSEPNQGLAAHLLPFVSQMNQNVLGTHSSRFFVEFFESLKTAMAKVKAGNSHELKVLVDTYFECYHQVMRQIVTNAEFVQVEDKGTWQLELVDRFLVGPMRWGVAENPRALEHVARNVGLILGYWKVHAELYRELWERFWSTAVDTVFATESGSGELGSQIQLIISLRRTDVSSVVLTSSAGSSPQKSKAKKVTFGGGSDDESEKPSRNAAPETTLRSNHWEELFRAADLMSQTCIRGMVKSPSAIFMRLLYKLLSQFDDTRLANSLDKVMPIGEFVEKLLEWICDESIASEEMVDLLLDFGTKTIPLASIVDKLMGVENYSVKNWTVAKISSDPKVILTEFTSVSVYMEHVLVRLINELSPNENAKILRTYLDRTLSGRPTEVHRTLIEMICTEIEEGNRANNQLMSLAKFLIKRIEGGSDEAALIGTRLFTALFHMTLHGMDSDCHNVLLEIVNDRMVAVSDSLSGLCMDMVKQSLQDQIEADNFDLTNIRKCCLLLLDVQGKDNLQFILSHLSVDEEDDYIIHLKDIVDHIVEGRVRGPKTCAPVRQSANHLRSLMTSCTVGALKAQLIQTSKSTNKGFDLLALERIRDASVALRDFNYEEDIFNSAVDSFLEALGCPEYQPEVTVSPKKDPNNVDNNTLAKELRENRHLLSVHFSKDASSNSVADKAILRQSMELLGKVMPLAKSRLINLSYNVRPDQLDEDSLWLASDLAVILRLLVENCPSEFTSEQWDFLRIAMSSWILTVSQCFEEKETRAVMLQFWVSVLGLFDALMAFFAAEHNKSSTQLFCKVIEEWHSVFAREVNTVLLLVLHKLLASAKRPEKNKYLVGTVLPYFQRMNFIYLLVSKDISKNVSQMQFLDVLFRQLSHPVPVIRDSVLRIASAVVAELVTRDKDQLLASDDSEQNRAKNGNYLSNTVATIFDEKEFNVDELVSEFQYKFTEAEDAVVVDQEVVKAYFYLWNVVFVFCRKATPELRAVYAQWIASTGMEAVLLKMIFRVLPQDLTRNFEAKSSMVETYFNAVKTLQVSDKSLSIEQLACFSYLNLVRLLPVVIRKCWTNLPHRINLLVEKFNMFYASGPLCQEELRTLMEKREQMDIQISVHNSTREIVAVYTKEEARMELMITLPLNFPLAVAKIEGGKSVNSRIQSKEVLMQLNLFLSHQNGAISNGLLMWKVNLDKKFEGVEECYVCYSVIHQDTYQLPKLTCKTCKKRFHSPCLYRWFSTSNKSTCPICRNIF